MNVLLKYGNCLDGYKVLQRNNEFCEPCDDNEAGTEGVCSQCIAGKMPNEDRTKCVLCPAHWIGNDGRCDVNCQDTGTEANALHTECLPDEWTIDTTLQIVFGISSLICGALCSGGGAYACWKNNLCCFKQDGQNGQASVEMAKHY